MLLSKFAFIKTAPSNYRHWKELGYPIVKLTRANACSQRLKVSISHLQSGSNVTVACRCNNCGAKYLQRFCRDKDICYPCRKVERMIGNNFGTANSGKKVPHMSGQNHPRWNPNKPAFRAYWGEVKKITEATYSVHKKIINPLDMPRTLCGVPDGWQLDHIISVKRGFIDGISPKVIGSLDNLQMLPWEDNRKKHFN